MCSSLTLCVCAGLRMGAGLMLWTAQLTSATLSHGSTMIHDHFLRPGAPAGPPACPQNLSASCSDCSSCAVCIHLFGRSEDAFKLVPSVARWVGRVAAGHSGTLTVEPLPPSRRARRQMRVRAPPLRCQRAAQMHCRAAWRRAGRLTRRAGLCVPRQLVECREA